MSLYSLFFTVGPALKLMMGEGRRITTDDFKELTPEQYEQLHKQGHTSKGRIMALYHKHADGTLDTGKMIMICEEEELSILDDAWNYIEHVCEDSSVPCLTEVDKLRCVAKTLPDVFIKGGPFERICKKKG